MGIHPESKVLDLSILEDLCTVQMWQAMGLNIQFRSRYGSWIELPPKFQITAHWTGYVRLDCRTKE